MSERPHVLDELAVELDRVAVRHLGKPPSVAERLRRGPTGRLSALAMCIGLLVLAAAATAAVLLIRQGSPIAAPHAQDLRSSGIPLPGSAHLAGLDAPDPDSSNPDWDLRLSRTKNGETCTAVGQVLDSRFGIVGLDHVFRALPLGSVDSCGIDTPDGPLLAGAHDFVGAKPSEARTVLSGVAGRGARSVSAYAAGEPRRELRLGADGSFITVYAGEAEALRPRLVVIDGDGRSHTIALEQSSAFETPDPDGGAAWVASSEADLQTGAYPDEDCVQVTQENSQSEPIHLLLPLTPEICGRLGSAPLFVQMRRFVPGEDSLPFPWHNNPSRTIIYGIAGAQVTGLSLAGAGSTRRVAIDPHGGALLAVLDGHVDPRSLTLTAKLRGGGTRIYSKPTALFNSQDNRPIGPEPVPAYRVPGPTKLTLPPPELPISPTVRETLRAEDPAGGPTWVLRSWRGKPNPKVAGNAHEPFLCASLGVLEGDSLVEPGTGAASHSVPLGIQDERCNSAESLTKMHYMLSLESFLDNPNEYAPYPSRTVISGMLPPDARDPVLIGVGAQRALTVDSNNAFLLVLPGRYWKSSPSISYLLHGHRVSKIGPAAHRRLMFPLGSAEKLPQVRAPDPDGGAPWGFAATADCSTAIGRIVDGHFASIDMHNGVLKTGADVTGYRSSCLTHPEALGPARLRHQPVEFNVQPISNEPGLSENESEHKLDLPEIERRTLPGQTVITGIARADVASVTLSTPSDVRTLRPSGPLHTILAVYDGFFLRGDLTATVRLRDGRVENEQVDGPNLGSHEPPSLAMRLREATRLLAQAPARARNLKLPAKAVRGYLKMTAEHLQAIERHVDFQRSHPGRLPAE
jgi:hypothetical protein